MASIALQTGLNVAGTLTLRLNIVVAKRTAATHFSMIKINCRLPSQWRMTTIATVGGNNVVDRLCRCPNHGSHTMAGGTIARRTLEYGIDMAGFAGQVTMLTDQLESRGQVIKLGTHGCLGAERSNQQHKCDQHTTQT
jgi:hypothetical protein